MPELPEVETIRRGLDPLLCGRRLLAVTLREGRLRETITPRELGRLRGARITGIRRRGKYLLVDTDLGRTLLVHLGMTGQIWVSERGRPRRPHEHAVFALDDGRELRFADARRFGMLRVLPSRAVARDPRLRGLGPEPLGDGLSARDLHRATRRRSRPVKNFLMDARAVAGVGNIYACEALHRAGLHPRRAVGRIGPAGWERLVAAVRAVLGEAITAGGTTIQDFRNAEWEAGSFAVALRVYDRAGRPCRRCGAAIRRIVQSGRGTFYCPRCQR